MHIDGTLSAIPLHTTHGQRNMQTLAIIAIQSTRLDLRLERHTINGKQTFVKQVNDTYLLQSLLLYIDFGCDANPMPIQRHSKSRAAQKMFAIRKLETILL